MTTESDRELLELAAEAAGMTYLIWTPGSAPLVPVEHRYGDRICWHPLADDGDALRLAVKLNIEIIPGMAHWGPVTYTNYPNKMGLNGPLETHGSDAMAATRRAIVRAAAEIARATHKEGA